VPVEKPIGKPRELRVNLKKALPETEVIGLDEIDD
jgi:hypothetical protein